MGSRTRIARGDGFTLLETMIALSILAFGLLSVAAMQLTAMQFANRGRHQTQAAFLAESRMEFFQRQRWTSLAPTAGWTAPTTVNHVVQDGGTKVEQAYDISWQIANGVAGQTRTIDVRVVWNEQNRPSRQFVISSVRFNREGL